MFVGKIGLRKGVPYLLRAVQACAGNVHLTLIGTRESDIEDLIPKDDSRLEFLPPRTKRGLRDLYWTSDLLVLPTLGDSFGFVALEAMACGLPVIVTENCGVPVPDASWRVPIMDSASIARRLQHYAEDGAALEHDGLTARNFAKRFASERYLEQIKGLFRELLEGNSPTLSRDQSESHESDLSGRLAESRSRARS
jgi:glycosyltransferase involved in cell wall biosynthesis